MKNLNEIYSQIKFSTIMTTGRTGSDYLQACLDNVPGILTFCGHFPYYRFCDNLKLNKFEESEPIKILELFIHENYHLLIKDDIENKNINLDIQKFTENFIHVCGKENLTRQKFLLSVYLAYHLTLDRDTSNINTLVHHSHTYDETRRFLEDFKNSKLLITIRDPRANLKSGILNWIKYDEKRENQRHFYIYIKRIREDLKFAQKQMNEKFFLKLEEANDIINKKKLSSFLDVKFSPEIMKATFADKIWIGDKLSRFNSKDGGYNKSVINNQWENFFSKKDKLVLDLIYKDYRLFGYKINEINWIKKASIFFLIPLPFVFDKNTFSLKYFFKKNISTRKKIYNIVYYLKRILYLYKLLFRLD